jgi:uncharacterized integral membrane protein
LRKTTSVACKRSKKKWIIHIVFAIILVLLAIVGGLILNSF